MLVLNGNLQKLYLVCDVSASMAEDGKWLLMRGMVRTVEQYVRLGYGTAEIKLLFWNDETKIVEWNPDDEFPIETPAFFEGATNLPSLINFYDSLPQGKILLFTDCCWINDEMRGMRNWMSMLPPDTVRIIKIGSEALLRWKKDEFYLTDEIFFVLDNWLPVADNMMNNNEEDEW